jgi:hypothetical protein
MDGINVNDEKKLIKKTKDENQCKLPSELEAK